MTASLASTINIKTTNTYNIGSADLGLAGIYFGTADTDTARIVSAALAADRTYTLPDAGAAADFVMTAGTQTIAGAKTFSDAAVFSSTTSFTGNATFDTTTLFVDAANNRVGIGTVSPTTSFQITSAGSPIITINNTSGATWKLGEGVGTNNILSFRASSVRSTDTLSLDATNDRAGVGTNAPATNLHVSNSGGSTGIRCEDTAANSAPHIDIRNDARNWTVRVDGADADNFIIRDDSAPATRLKIDTSGFVSINRTTPSHKLSIGETGTAPLLLIREDTGTAMSFIQITGADGATACGQLQGNTTAQSVALANASDRRIKENLRPMPAVLDRLREVKLHEYELKESGGTAYGVIAQELVSLFPELVVPTDDGTGPIDPAKGPWQVLQAWHYILVKGLQELAAKVA